MKEKIVLTINKTAYIEILIPSKEKDLYRYDEIKIILRTSKNKYVLYSNECIDALQDLDYCLTDILNGRLQLHKSIYNIGYQCNEDYHSITEDSLSNLIYVMHKGVRRWVGERYMVWSTTQRYSQTTWLYVKDKQIILEVTPDYKWHFDEPKKNEKFIEYSEFMKNYQNFYKVVLDKETIVAWHRKCRELLQIIDRYFELEIIEENNEKICYKILMPYFNCRTKKEGFGYIEIDKIHKIYHHKHDELWIKNKIYPIKLFELSGEERKKIISEKYQDFGRQAWAVCIFNFVQNCFLENCYPKKKDLFV